MFRREVDERGSDRSRPTWLAVTGATLLGVVLGTGAHVAVGATSPAPAPRAEVAGAVLERDVPGAVLEVSAHGCGIAKQASATVVQGPRGPVVLTNAHVVTGAGTVVVRTPAGDVTARVAGVVQGRDAAVLRVDPGEWPEGVAPTRPVGADARTGDPVDVTGFPAGDPERRAGRVTSIEPRQAYGGTTSVLVIDAPAEPGSSGGAVLDVTGAVVGLVAARDPGSGATVAYPVRDLLDGTLVAAPGC